MNETLKSAESESPILNCHGVDLSKQRTRRAVHSINLRVGLPLIEIVSPEEVIEFEE